MPKKIEIKATDTTFYFPAKQFLAVHNAVSKEETRYYLNGVFFDTRDQLQIVATEGHVLMNCALPDAAFVGAGVATQEDGFILKTDVMEKAFKAKTKGDLWVYGDIDTGILQFVDSDDKARVGVCEFERIKGTFPDWRRVVPAESDKRAAASFNPDLLIKFQKAHKIMDGGAMRLTAHAANEPALIDFSRAPEFKGVIMPIRS